MPRPLTPGRGRGLGRAVRFPTTVLDQFGALLRLRRESDSPLKLRMWLWLDGYPVPWERLRADFCELLSGDLSELTRVVSEPDELGKALRGSRRLPLRRRGLSSDDFALLGALMAEPALGGALPYDLANPVDGVSGETIGQLTERAFGFGKEREPWMPKQPGAPLAAAAAHEGLSFQLLRETVASATAEEGAFAREVIIDAKTSPALQRWYLSARRSPLLMASFVGPAIFTRRHPELAEALRDS